MNYNNYNNVMQYLIAGLIVVAALYAAVRAIVLTVRGRKSNLTACSGCKLQEFCQKPEKNSVKKCGDKVAQVKNRQ